jgi:hypothetical protein
VSTLLTWLRLEGTEQGWQLLLVLLQRAKAAGSVGAGVALEKLGSSSAVNGARPKMLYFRQ